MCWFFLYREMQNVVRQFLVVDLHCKVMYGKGRWQEIMAHVNVHKSLFNTNSFA